MTDFENAELEQKIRNVVIGHRPPAPEGLVDYIDTVPATNRRAGRLGLALGRPRVRRSFVALACAAAVIIAVIGSAGLVSYRQTSAAASEWPSSSVSDGWAWQATDGTLFVAAMEVPNGFVATCGRRSGQEIVDQTLCSSPDGLRWSKPADPAIVSVEGADPFLPQGILVRNGLYLATSTRGSGEFQGPVRTLWRSTDGVHWVEVDTSVSLGSTADVNLMGLVPDGFMAVVSTNQAGTSSEMGVFISVDGVAWAKASDLPFETGSAGSGYYLGPTMTAGLYAAGISPSRVVGDTWRTTNGRDWSVVNMLAGYSQLGSVVTLPDGSLRGVASSFDSSAALVMVDSADGLSWQIDPTAPTGSVDVFVVVGDRMVAYVSSTPFTDPHQVLQSDDWGKSWRPLLDLSGKPVVDQVETLGGRLEIRGADLAVHWLLTPVQRNAASPEPSASAPVESPSAADTPTSLPSPTAESSPSAVPSDLPVPTAEAPSESPSDLATPTPPESAATS
ncbi:MAG TPA: hypothetical protein VF337_00260 [Candidatus Limnocylindrales bacterium]